MSWLLSVSDIAAEAFDITQLKPVSFREHTWDRLILDEEYRDVLEATVSAHIDKTAQLNDPWLGNGFSIVLRGEPGTGKTLLAGTLKNSARFWTTTDHDS